MYINETFVKYTCLINGEKLRRKKLDEETSGN